MKQRERINNQMCFLFNEMKCIRIEGWWITDNEIFAPTIVERE
jgi:hypothetical protein